MVRRRLNPLEPDEEFESPPPAQSAAGTRATLALSLLGLAALLAFQAVLLKTWIAGETRPPSWDQAIHMEIAFDYRALLAKGDWDGVFHLKPKPGMPPFPPMYHLSLMRALDEGDPVRAALWVQYGYLVLLIISLYGLGRHYGGDWAGLGAAVLFSTAPVVQWLTRTQLPDLALTAWVAAGYWAYAWSDRFFRWKGSLVFGVAAGAAMMTKWSAWTYFLPIAYVWLLAARDPLRRRRAAAALIPCLVACVPWYWVQLPTLVPRLLQAAGDQGVPVWAGWSVLTYLWGLVPDLDTPFWALSIVALLTPGLRRGKEDGWVMPASVICAYVFWTLVPNRQVRFLLPGLPPLAVLIAGGPLPRWVLGALGAWQLLTAANYTHAWVRTVSADFLLPVRFLSSWKPAKEDWKIGEILREAASRRDRAKPFGNMTLVANDVYFNGPAFNWTVKRLGMKTLRIRGVNSRLCEFSEFVVVKTESLGPATVVNQLPEARRLMLEASGWFQKGYKEAKRWPLPDKSEAVLFVRRKPESPPMPERPLRYDYFETGQFLAKNLTVDLGRYDAAKGAYPRARVRAKELTLRGVRITNVDVRFDDLLLVPVRDAKKVLQDVRLLSLGRLTVESVSIKEEDAAAFVAARAPALKEPSVMLDKDAVVAAGWHGIPLGLVVAAALADGPRRLVVRLEKARLGPAAVDVPESWGRFDVLLEPNPETPFDIRLKGLTLKKGRLAVP